MRRARDGDLEVDAQIAGVVQQPAQQRLGQPYRRERRPLHAVRRCIDPVVARVVAVVRAEPPPDPAHPMGLGGGDLPPALGRRPRGGGLSASALSRGIHPRPSPAGPAPPGLRNAASGEPRPRLSVLVPVYNEVATVRALLTRVMAVPIPKEIIVVDDGSTDGTRAVLEEMHAATPATPENRLVVLFQERNQGKGAAVRRAVGHVTGEIALVQAADLEYDPAEYPRLLQPILDGHADVVFGSRFAGSPRRVLFFWHTVANRLLTLVSNLCTNLNLTDMETCYKVFRADILRRIPIRSNRFGLEPELTAKVAHLRCRVYEVPIAYHGRQYSEGKKIGWKDGVSAFWTILRFTIRPDVGREDEGYTTLRRVEVLRRYTAFLWDLMRPYVGRRVLEVGSGTGVMTQYLSTREEVVASDVDPEYVEFLRRTFADKPNVQARLLDLAHLGADGLAPHRFDTVVCANVLEHVADDAASRSEEHTSELQSRLHLVCRLLLEKKKKNT